MVGQVIESKRTEGVTAKVIEYNEKFNTVIIEYLTGDKAGTSNSITTSTLKRWWKEIEVQEKTVEVESELTDEQYAQIGLEIAEQAKKKVEEHKLVPMPGAEKLAEVKLESVITKLQDAGFTVNIVKGLSKTISIKTVGQLAISKNGFRLKANLNFEFTSETSYETTKNYNKVMCETLEDVLKIIQ